MHELYKYTSEMGIQDYIYSMCKSVWENETQAKELVAKRIVNFFGYPNNIEVNLYQGSSKTEFVDVKTNEILASVETANDGIVFYTETKYYGDWYK